MLGIPELLSGKIINVSLYLKIISPRIQSRDKGFRKQGYLLFRDESTVST